MLSLILLLVACKDDKADDTGSPVDTAPADDTGSTDDTGEPDETVTRQGCDASHDAFIAALQEDLDDSDAPGVTAALMEGGVVTCRVALGTKGADTEALAGIDTFFQIGSTTKMFTALAVLQRVEDGTFALDDTLAEVVPGSEFDLDEGWNDEILVQHLLTHQGAFYDYIDIFASADDADLQAWHEDFFFQYIWLMNAPGAFWNYANPNFDVAGLALEVHDDRYYPDLMVEDVFRPLGMARTVQRRAEVEADGDFAEGVGYSYASASSASYGAVPIEDVPDPAHGRPAGVGTWTTPDQVLAMARFLMEGDAAVLDDELRQAMTTPQVGLGYDFTDSAYGYGVFINSGFEDADSAYYAIDLWEHGGNTQSYSSELWMVPEQGFAVSILSSGYVTDFSRSVAAALTSLVELPDAQDPPGYPWDPDRLDLHTGTYEDAYNVGPAVVTREGDLLYVELPLLDEYGISYVSEMYPISSDTWYLNVDGSWYDIAFIGGEGDTKSQWARNRYFVATRTEEGAEGAAMPSRAEVERALRAGRLPRVPLVSPAVPRLPRPPR